LRALSSRRLARSPFLERNPNENIHSRAFGEAFRSMSSIINLWITYRIYTLGSSHQNSGFHSEPGGLLQLPSVQSSPLLYDRLYERSSVLAFQSADQPGRTMVKSNRSRPPLESSLTVLKQQLRQDVLQQSPAHAAELYRAAIHLLGALKQDQARLCRIQ